MSTEDFHEGGGRKKMSDKLAGECLLAYASQIGDGAAARGTVCMFMLI